MRLAAAPAVGATRPWLPLWVGRLTSIGILGAVPLAAALVLKGHALLGGVLLLVPVVVPAVVAMPRVALALVIIVDFSNASTRVGTHSGISLYLASLVIAVTALVVHLRANRIKLPRSPIYVLTAAFVASRALTILVARDPDLVVSGTVENLKDLVFLVTVTGLLITTRSQLTIVKVIVAAAAVLAGLTLVQEFVFHNTTDFFGFSRILVADIGSYSARHTGPDFDANYWARTLLLFLPLALSLWSYRGGGRRRWLWLGVAAVLVGGVYLTSSRGGLIAMGVVIVGWLILAGRSYQRLLLLAPVVVVLALTVPGLGSRLATLSQVSQAFSQGGDPSLVGRVTALKSGAAMFIDHPALGVGAANFRAAELDYERRLGLQHTKDVAPHNLYLQMAAEGGLIGIVLWLVFYAGGCFLAIKAAVVSRLLAPGPMQSAGSVLATGALISLAGWSVASVFLHLEHFRQLLMMMALAASLAYAADEAAEAALDAR